MNAFVRLTNISKTTNVWIVLSLAVNALVLVLALIVLVPVIGNYKMGIVYALLDIFQ